MRPLRLILLLISFVVCPIIFTFLTLLSPHPPQQVSTSSSETHQKSGFRALFSFHTPSSLFPPSAIISLTDDNSTFFLARPAAFGPLLPSRGLSGQLWVGSGFGDDNLRRGGTVLGAEGELGCSDVPGWGEGDTDKIEDSFMAAFPSKRKAVSHAGDQAGKAIHEAEKSRRSTTTYSRDVLGSPSKDAVIPSEEDGTDDYLHHPLPGSEALRSPMRMRRDAFTGKGKFTAHADIQSLQESAEITGKIALLSRGGCGFLEKVKWVQRRGGVALIVGDNTRGGGLVTMYARGDTSNVTIPSLFTSHTTAHLLSSLIPPGSSADDFFSAEPTKIGQDETRSKGLNRKKGSRKSKGTHDGTIITSTTGKVTPTSTSRPTIVPASTKVPSPVDSDSASQSEADWGWLGSILAIFGIGDGSPQSRLPQDSRRPPSSGQLDWVLIGHWEDEDTAESRVEKDSRGAAKSAKLGASHSSASPQSPDDDFVIGVQDWRDPDLLGGKDAIASSSSSGSPIKEPLSASGHRSKIPAAVKSADNINERLTKTPQNGDKAWEGGSITPGSGEYAKPGDEGADSAKAFKLGAAGTPSTANGILPSEVEDRGWFQHLPWLGDDGSTNTKHSKYADQALHGSIHVNKGASHVVEDLYSNDEDLEEGEGHEGLWVTLTPTSVSASPFFDTLLVLVISPLVTLTVVYALLLLRSRIRRRRWRAPKSVVDRLPVRTYQTMTCPSTSPSPAPASPNPSSYTTPLLPTSSRSISPRPRPRSRATSEVGTAVTASPDKTAMRASLLQHEKFAGSRQWKRRYAGKQVECVVCLEEYVDGQSRVMSLPCGHEFHAECITPWLTTRRRTCPICKGDVVRSMNGGSSTTTAQPAYRDEPSEELQTEVRRTGNESPSAAIPVPHTVAEGESDLERGDDMAATLVNDGTGTSRSGWRGLASLSLSALSGEAAWRQAQADRGRSV